ISTPCSNITHLYQFDYIRMVQLFKDSNLLVDSLQWSFRLSRTLGRRTGEEQRQAGLQLTWETCLPHQPSLGQHLHRLQEREREMDLDWRRMRGKWRGGGRVQRARDPKKR
uniref:Uncharacterized protein n=1 Tax=Amphiprion ocellaris TaxID=80972 RepID=A0AAQ6AEL6_AMPOC